MRHLLRSVCVIGLAVAALLSTVWVSASEQEQQRQHHLMMVTSGSVQTQGLTPAATAALLEQQDEQMLFIDVRDPVEIMFVGTPLGIDANIPYLLVDRHDFDADNTRFRLNQNPDFAGQVAAALAAKGLGKDALVVTLCRSGSERGEPSARYLLEQGFTNVRYVIHGFQGDAQQDGPQQGLRILNGWQNEGQPWQPRVDPTTIYRP